MSSVFFNLGSFMAAKTEPVVLPAKVGHTGLWNLLCNLASRSLKKIFCFPPFLHVYPQLKEKRELWETTLWKKKISPLGQMSKMGHLPGLFHSLSWNTHSLPMASDKGWGVELTPAAQKRLLLETRLPRRLRSVFNSGVIHLQDIPFAIQKGRVCVCFII